MNIDSHMMIVVESRLCLAPKAFQDYVEKYFKPTILLGRTCLYAFRVLSMEQYKSIGKGVAPRHSIDLDIFKDELPDGVSLSEWISSQRNSGYFQEFSESWDDGCTGSVVDCD